MSEITPGANPARRGRVLMTVVKVAVTLAILFFLLFNIDFDELIATAQSFHPGWYALAFAQLSLGPFIGGARWLLTLRSMGEREKFWPVTRLFWSGMLFSQVLPSQAGGDAVRALLLRWRGHNLGVAVNSVVLERMVMVLALLVIVCAIAPVSVARLGVPGNYAWTALLILVGVLAGIAMLTNADFIVARFAWLQRLAHNRIGRAALRLSADCRRVCASWFTVPIFLLALAGNINQLIFAIWLGQAIGMDLSPLSYFAVVPIIFLSTLLPISIGGWGVREGVSVVLFGLLGVSNAEALLFSVLFGGTVVLSSLPALPMWWFDAKRSPDRAVATGAAE